MITPSRTQRPMVASVTLGVGAELTRQPMLHLVPASREEPVVVAMGLVCHVVLLPHIDCIAILLAVVAMVAHRLHTDATTGTDHDISVRAMSLPGGCDLEGVGASLGATARCESRTNPPIANAIILRQCRVLRLC